MKFVLFFILAATTPAFASEMSAHEYRNKIMGLDADIANLKGAITLEDKPAVKSGMESMLSQKQNERNELVQKLNAMQLQTTAASSAKEQSAATNAIKHKIAALNAEISSLKDSLKQTDSSAIRSGIESMIAEAESQKAVLESQL